MRPRMTRPARTTRGTTLGWQTMLADLALILFMITAAAMGDPPSRGAGSMDHTEPAHQPGLAAPWSAQGEPLAIWRATPGGTSLASWLATQAVDQRQQLTLAVRYRPRHLAAALVAAQQLAGDAGASGLTPRIIVEPLTDGDRSHGAANGADLEVTAGLAYDRPAAAGAIGT